MCMIFPGFYLLAISDIMKSRYMWIWTSLITIIKVVSTEEFKIRINVNNNTIESTAKFFAKERPSLIELQYFDFDGTVRIWTVFYKKVLLCSVFLQSRFFSLLLDLYPFPANRYRFQSLIDVGLFIQFHRSRRFCQNEINF